MKKIISLLLVTMMMLSCCSFAFAESQKMETRAGFRTDAGLAHVSGSTYSLWGQIIGSAGDSLSITVEVYKSGSYITGLSGSGTGPTVYKSKNVSLASGTYTLKITGTSSTGTNTTTKNVVI